MQNLTLPSVRLYTEHRDSVRFSPNVDERQHQPMTCPDCGTQCQASGKVKNSWYAHCKCGAYIQLCPSVSEYHD